MNKSRNEKKISIEQRYLTPVAATDKFNTCYIKQVTVLLHNRQSIWKKSHNTAVYTPKYYILLVLIYYDIQRACSYNTD